MRHGHVICTLVVTCVFAVLLDYTVDGKARYKTPATDYSTGYAQKRIRKQRTQSQRPNIVIIMTDDQDIMLGSMNHMPKTKRIITDAGARFENAFVTTPMCCPSRSTFLTGMYPHNHNVFTNNDNCSSQTWRDTHEKKNFATYLSNVGYRTGYFGKYLNEYAGDYIPPGWREWVALIRNSRFYNYSINFNGKRIKHGNNYYEDYLTDLIANDSVTFLRQSKQNFRNRPVLMVLSLPAPHGPEDAAPKYQTWFANNTDHRTPSWNYAPNPDKQWLLQTIGKMEPIHKTFTDVLQQKRLQTLQSVDDLIQKVKNELSELNELDNTYMMYMSDHGYHLGQYGLLKGKAMPYDFDVRIPLMMRGPGVPQGITVSNIVSNIDFAPTILDMAGIDVPDHMDGLSLLRLTNFAKDPSKVDVNGFVQFKKAWRETVLLERGKITEKKQKEVMRAEKRRIFDNVKSLNISRDKLVSILSPREMKLVEACRRDEYQLPCKRHQHHACQQDENGKLHIRKCDNLLSPSSLTSSASSLSSSYQEDSPCVCPSYNEDYYVRNKRSMEDLSSRYSEARRKGRRPAYRNIQLDGDRRSVATKRCRILANDTIHCDRKLYTHPHKWKNQKDRIDGLIQRFRQKIYDLKGIRKHLKRNRPAQLDEDMYGRLNDDGQCVCDTRYLSDDVRNDGASSDYAGRYDDIYTDDFDLGPEYDISQDPLPHQFSSKKQWKRKMKKMKKLKKRHKKNCNKPHMKCFTHDDDHWQTPPLWDHFIGARRKDPRCKRAGYECQSMVNEHWKHPPYWNMGPFCFCSNSNNNTYWCLRTINETHNFVYCEFITRFISYYDMNKDPYQLHNVAPDLNYGILQILHETLNKLRGCRGPKACTIRTRESLQNNRRDRRRRRKRRRYYRHDKYVRTGS